ncbi:helix-turn-helix transcriptional regulator [Psychrobacter ciconiae]|uniref:helix-turn-helix transcriptional regulator n=1 Tax=Psychrobacter ciconiae TaxID=1553449 RepID=UPI001918D632|nr:AlpA family transcriptional regulator [Psychrobacter ciconiae]
MENLNATQPVIEQCNHIPQLLSIKDVIHYTGLSRSTIYEMIDENSDRHDPTFPKKVQLTKVRVVWVASEVAEWINNKIASRSNV